MQDFSVERGPFLEGWDKILLLGKAPKFGGIFQKFALEKLKVLKFMKKIS